MISKEDRKIIEFFRTYGGRIQIKAEDSDTQLTLKIRDRRFAHDLAIAMQGAINRKTK